MKSEMKAEMKAEMNAETTSESHTNWMHSDTLYYVWVFCIVATFITLIVYAILAAI